MEHRADHDLFLISYVEKKSWQEKLGMAAEASVDRTVGRWLTRLSTRFFW
jgi:serine protease SohB